MCACASVSVCERERQGEKKRDKMRKPLANPFTIQLKDFQPLSKG